MSDTDPNGLNVTPGAPVIGGLGRDMAWKYAQFSARALVSVFASGFAIRVLGPRDFGFYTLIMAATGLASLLDLGMSLTVVRAAAREEMAPDEETRRGARDHVRAATSGYLVLGVVAALSFILLSPTGARAMGGAEQRTALTITIALLAIDSGLRLASAGPMGVAIGRRQFRLLGMLAVGGSLVQAVGVVGLIGPFGIVGLGVGQLAGTVVERVLLFRWAFGRLRWLRVRPSVSSVRPLVRVLKAGSPLLVLAIGAQVITNTDLLILAVMSQPADVAFYKLGSVPPAYLAAVLTQGYEVLFPALSGSFRHGDQEDAAWSLATTSSFAGGVVFGAAIGMRAEAIELLAGQHSSLAEHVLAVFALVWLVITMSGSLVMLLLARGRHAVFVPLVGGQIAANVLLTVVLVSRLGPIGAAVATLIVMTVSNLVVLPVIFRRQYPGTPALFLTRSAVGPAAAGLAAGGIGSAVGHYGGAAPFPALVIAGSVAVAVACAMALAFLSATQGKLLVPLRGTRRRSE